MKILFIAVSLLMLTGCDGPLPMSDAEAKAFEACMDKGLKPYFRANGSIRELSCKRK